MFKTFLTLSLFISLNWSHDDINISISQSVNGVNVSSEADHSSDMHYAEDDSPYKMEGFNIEDYRHYDYPFVEPENKDYVCTYWSCREYPCRCILKQPRCDENYVYNAHDEKCEPTDRCLSQWKGCGAGEVFSYDTCECECYIECASDEIRLPGVCLCGKGTFPVYNEWAVGRYFGEKNASKGFNK